MPCGQRSAVDQRRLAESLVLTLPSYPEAGAGNAAPGIRHTDSMPAFLPRRIRPRGVHLHLLSLGSIGLCVVLWIRAKTIGEDERGNAERRALFVGLWPPMLWLIGDALQRSEQQDARGRRGLRRG
jgi:hypothetical protein